MKKKDDKLLSVIIPVFRQSRTIVKNIKNVRKALDEIRYDYELLIVVDGCFKSYLQAKKTRNNKTRIYFLKENQGKGFAVRHGMSRAKGDYIAFLDAGMEIDPNGISMLLEHMEWYNADVIVGSKRHLVSVVNYPLERRVLSFGFFWLVRILFGVKIKDTQAGIKIYKREVLEKILPLLMIKRYAFDIEMLSVASRFGYKRIYEAPIKLDFKFDNLTNAAALNTIWKMLWDTAAVFYRLNILRYYDKQKKTVIARSKTTKQSLSM